MAVNWCGIFGLFRFLCGMLRVDNGNGRGKIGMSARDLAVLSGCPCGPADDSGRDPM